MAADNFIYQGINRAVSDYAGSRACEELINLRPADGGVVPVRDFTTKMYNVPYERVYVHHATDGDHYIVISKTSAGVTVQELDSVLSPIVPALFHIGPSSMSAEVQQRVVDNLHFATAGNIVLFSLCDKEDSKYGNWAFIRKMDGQGVMTYVEMEANVPEISFEVKDDNTEPGATSDVSFIWQKIAHLGNESSVAECTEAVQNGLNAIAEENPNVCLGPVVIAVAFKTTDGNTFWTGGWRVYDPIPTVMADPNTPYTDETEAAEYFDRFFDKYHFGYLAGMTHGDHLEDIFACGTNVRLEFDQISSWDEESSIVQSLEVYASRPQIFLDANGARDGLFELSPDHPSDDDYQLFLPQVKYENMDLANQLLYHQASIPMASLAAGDQTVNLTFGGNVQVTEDTLDTDAGALKRYGRILSYNARFHYFDSVSHINVGTPSFSIPPDTGTVPVEGSPHVFVRYSDNEHDELMYLGTTEDDVPLANKATVVIAPSINIKEVIMYFLLGGVYIKRTYRMDASASYNYSINVDGGVETHSSTDDATLRRLIDAGAKTGLDADEPDAINVTEQYNPFVFRVEHSYKAPGNIIDVLPQMAGVVDANYGRDPLNVFTERGLYALTQGSANVLYGAFLPLSNLKAARGGLSLEPGIYFLADGGLWLVSGRRVALVSEALDLGPHKYVRACTGYKKLSGTDTNFSPDPAPANPFYDVSPYLSQVEFKDFATGGRLAYNRFRMEIFVSNPAYEYSYVLSLKYRQWFKVSKRLWQDEPGSTLINRPGTTLGTISVMDMSQEMTVSTIPLLVHLQSRPFSMGYQYCHVHRIVAMVRALLESASHKLAVGLYGSDDLQHWKLLAYAKRSGKTEYDEQTEQYVDTPLFLSQVRTTSSARSWRYYTVCIGGEIPVDPDFPTDVGPVIVDYEPVIRRIG